MASFFLKNEQREHLKLLRDKSPEVVVELCKLALEYLNKGPNDKKYQSLAKKLNTPAELVQPTVEALVSLLIDATKANVTEAEFENLKNSGFSMDHIAILWQFVSSKRGYVENILKSISTKEYRFRDLEWRIEAKIASRSLLKQCTPVITLKFHLDSESVKENRDTKDAQSEHSVNTKKEVLAETDPHNLVHIIEVLEQGLVEAKTHRTRNILKTFH